MSNVLKRQAAEDRQAAKAFDEFAEEVYDLLEAEVELTEASRDYWPRWVFIPHEHLGTGFRLDLTEANFLPLADWDTPRVVAKVFAAALVKEWPDVFRYVIPKSESPWHKL